MTPVALAVARLPGGPPSQVTFLPAFWLLVPGAIGLIGSPRSSATRPTASLEDLIQPVAAVRGDRARRPVRRVRQPRPGRGAETGPSEDIFTT